MVYGVARRYLSTFPLYLNDHLIEDDRLKSKSQDIRSNELEHRILSRFI